MLRDIIKEVLRLLVDNAQLDGGLYCLGLLNSLTALVLAKFQLEQAFVEHHKQPDEAVDGRVRPHAEYLTGVCLSWVDRLAIEDIASRGVVEPTAG